ncbi:MAG: CinA family nicotinamide mononucleotide deamidase-related protein [Syntrophobacteraceae bacterium]
MVEGHQEVVGTLITVGDEILLGDIVNGNSQFIAATLRGHGFRFQSVLTVGDEEEVIVAALTGAIEKRSFLIVTGGLGPTDDDRTAQAVSRAFGLLMKPDPTYLAYLQERVRARGGTWNEEIGRMALLPEGGVKLGRGMAGFSLVHRNVPCYFLPGVPYEMKQLLTELVVPDLMARFPRRMAYGKRILRIQGLPESLLNELLKDMPLEEPGVQIGYLPQVTENWVTLFARATTEEALRALIERAERAVVARIGREHVLGANDDEAARVVGDLLRRRGWTLAVAESCTGGLLARRITAVPGASDYFDRGFITYSNQAKVDLLQVPAALIDAHGAVSEPVARAMAEGALRQARARAALAITGIAGPTGGAPDKPVGTVFIGCAVEGRVIVERHQFSGDRERIQERSAHAALIQLWRALTHD